MRRVVVTGIGPVTALGIGKEAFWDSIINQDMIIKAIPKEYEKNYHYKSRFYVPKPEVVLEEENSMMGESSKFARVAAKLALLDSELTDYRDAGVILGIGMSSLKTAFTSYEAHTTGEGRFNRMVIPILMAQFSFGMGSYCMWYSGCKLHSKCCLCIRQHGYWRGFSKYKKWAVRCCISRRNRMP